MKKCRECQIEKPLDEFGNDKRVKSGKRPKCLSCVARYTKAYRDKNKDYFDAHNKKYYSENTEKCNAASKKRYYDNKELVSTKAKEYYQLNKERLVEYSRKYRRNNPESVSNSKSNWKKNNPESCNASNQRRRTRKLSLDDSLTTQEWIDTLEHFGHACARCNSDIDVCMDHWIPLSYQGDNPGTVNWNVIPLCRSCNSSKNDIHPKIKYSTEKCFLTYVENYLRMKKEESFGHL